jgi:hypothetical protein
MAGHSSVNWAEIVTICITFAILIVGGIQAYIYWKQEGVMEASLSQNERAGILGSGQLTVAARNAKTAEDTLAEMKSGSTDTHTLAQSTRSAAASTRQQLDAFKNLERALLRVVIVVDKAKREAVFIVENIGLSAAIHVNAKPQMPSEITTLPCVTIRP